MRVRINNIEINYDFINLHYLKSSEPLLIFLHEGLGSIKQWKDFPIYLSTALKLPAFVYDRYGYGESSALKEKRNINFLFDEAEFLDLLLDKLYIDNPLILFGHSDGGTLALIFAAKSKREIIAVISEAHHIKIEDISKKGIRKAIEIYQKGKLRQLLYKYHGEKTDSVFYSWADTWLSPEADNWNIEYLIEQISSPILAIQGDNDQYGSEYQLNIIKEKSSNPLTKTYLLPNCGHIPHLEYPQTVIDLVKEFLEQILIKT